MHGTGRPGETRDAELVARIRSGDGAAFEELFTEHYEGMCALAFMLVRSRDAAEDVVSNVFSNLWRRRAKWHRPESVRSYLLTATRNATLNHLRELRRRQGLEDRLLREDASTIVSAPGEAPDDAAAAGEIAAAVQAATAELPPQPRTVFLLRWEEGLRHREIAERLGLSIKTVEMHMTRALRTIRERLLPLR